MKATKYDINIYSILLYQYGNIIYIVSKQPVYQRRGFIQLQDTVRLSWICIPNDIEMKWIYF